MRPWYSSQQQLYTPLDTVVLLQIGGSATWHAGYGLSAGLLHERVLKNGCVWVWVSLGMHLVYVHLAHQSWRLLLPVCEGSPALRQTQNNRQNSKVCTGLGFGLLMRWHTT